MQCAAAPEVADRYTSATICDAKCHWHVKVQFVDNSEVIHHSHVMDDFTVVNNLFDCCDKDWMEFLGVAPLTRSGQDPLICTDNVRSGFVVCCCGLDC